MWLVESIYYKSKFEKRVWPWQRGYVSWKIATHSKGLHSHEELIFSWKVIVSFMEQGGYSLSDMSALMGIPVYSGLDVCYSSSSRDHGVRFKPYFEVYKDGQRWDREGVTSDMQKALIMLADAIPEVGKPYDWPGVTGFKISFVDENPDKWYCTERCDSCKRTAGLWPEFYQSHPCESYRLQKFLTNAGVCK